VILSTHIVEDVSELCPNMAVLASGQILLEGNPIELTNTLQGKIWHKAMSQAEAVELEQSLPVIAKRLFAGKTLLSVFADDAPQGFEAKPADLEDVYFSTLHKHRNKAA
jgi:ABC-type multidrug transport system ATPase subunit